MAMMNKKDKPSLYNIVGTQSGAVIATAYKSKVFKLCKELQKQNEEKLEIIECSID